MTERFLIILLATGVCLLGTIESGLAGASGSTGDPLSLKKGTTNIGQDASQRIYPTDTTGLLIKNGNFKTPNVTPDNYGVYWGIFTGIEGWTAISGTRIELNGQNTATSEGQSCELASHWQNEQRDRGVVASDHGIKQTVKIPRGTYLLIFDYKGRRTGSTNNSVDYKSFNVKAKMEAGGVGEVSLLNVTDADVNTWKRAVVPFEIKGDDPATATEFDVVLSFDVDGSPLQGCSPSVDNILLLPVEMKVTDRDDPKQNWSNAKASTPSKTIYAGEFTGDMVSWKIGGSASWPNATFSWSAEGPESKTGPSGTGKEEWKFSDDQEDASEKSLTWKPGKYKIKCSISFSGGASILAEFDQEVGWRTDEWIAVGQIVETDEFSLSDAEKDQLRNAFYEDEPLWIAIGLIRIGLTGNLPALVAFEAALRQPAPELVAMGWGAFWGFAPRAGQINGVTDVQKYWVVQELLGRNRDFDLGQIATKTDQDRIFTGGEYRIHSRFQIKLTVDESGDLKKMNPVPPTRVRSGKTKAVIGLLAGDLFDEFGFQLPPADLNLARLQLKTELNPHSNGPQRLISASDKKSVALFASGRVGEEGRRVNWRLLGKDAPWIYVETIFKKQDQMPWWRAEVRASIDVVLGQDDRRPFNNLNFFKRNYSDPSSSFPYQLEKQLKMNGSLDDFLESGSSKWPGPPNRPTTQ